MYISKSDALAWFEFFAQLPEDEPLMPRQQEIALAGMAQIEAAENTEVNGVATRLAGQVLATCLNIQAWGA